MRISDIIKIETGDDKSDEKQEIIKTIKHCMIQVGVEKHEWVKYLGLPEKEIDKIIKKYADLADEVVRETQTGIAALAWDTSEMLKKMERDDADDNEED